MKIKNILFFEICFIVLFFIGCIYQEITENELKKIPIGKMNDYAFENEIKIFSITEIIIYIADNIKYVNEIFDYWQLPEETIKKGTGDCEDLCILAMFLFKTKLNLDTDLIMLKNIYTKEIHTLIHPVPFGKEVRYYDFTSNSYIKTIPLYWEFIFTIPYKEVIWMTYYYHNNVGIYY